MLEKNWNNPVDLQELRDLFELALQYVSNQNLPTGYNMVLVDRPGVVLYLSTASDKRNKEIKNIISKWIDNDGKKSKNVGK